METTAGNDGAARAALDAVQAAERRSFEEGREPLWYLLSYAPFAGAMAGLHTAEFEGVSIARLGIIALFLVATLWLRNRMAVGRVKRRFGLSPSTRIIGGGLIALPFAAIFFAFYSQRDTWPFAGLASGLCTGGYVLIVAIAYRWWENRAFERWLAAQS